MTRPTWPWLEEYCLAARKSAVISAGTPRLMRKLGCLSAPQCRLTIGPAALARHRHLMEPTPHKQRARAMTKQWYVSLLHGSDRTRHGYSSHVVGLDPAYCKHYASTLKGEANGRPQLHPNEARRADTIYICYVRAVAWHLDGKARQADALPKSVHP